MTTPYLAIDGLEKHFGTHHVLHNISLAIEQGEFICFLGPSGCGKTTLLRTIAGLELPSSGTIIQQGREVTLLPPEQRDFGIVFQSYALFPNLTVAQNIAFGLECRGFASKELARQVAHWLSLVGLNDQSHKYPGQISGGQQQRVALARALALSPSLLLLDEPLSALDAQVRHHLRGEIRALQQQLNITTIMVTHDQEEALAMADRIVVMDQGRIVQVGTPAEIYGRPESRFVASFVGSMNFLTALVINEREVRLNEMPLACGLAGLPAGGKVEIALRPEAIQVDEPGAGGLAATISRVEYQGSQLKLHCQAESYLGLQPVVVQIPLTQGSRWRDGERCSLHWPASAMHYFRQEAVA